MHDKNVYSSFDKSNTPTYLYKWLNGMKTIGEKFHQIPCIAEAFRRTNLKPMQQIQYAACQNLRFS